MGYLKYKKSNGLVGIIPTENVSQITDEGGSGELIIRYNTGYKLSIYDNGVSMRQEDVDATINGINILNGTSGSSMDLVLSQPIDTVDIIREN
jgi:hypothetical protein